MCCEKNVSHKSLFYLDFTKQNVMIQKHLSHLDAKLTKKGFCDHYCYVSSGQHPTT